MRLGFVQPRLSYYNGGAEKITINSILNLAKNSKDQFIIFTIKSILPETELYTIFKKEIPYNVKIQELEIPQKWKFLYKIKAGENRFRWDAESLYFNQLLLPLLKKQKIDLIWSQYILDSIIIPEEIPTILHLLGYPRTKSNHLEGLLSQYSKLVSNSDNVIKKWNNLLERKIKKYSILHQGIDCSKKTKEVKMFDKNKFTLVFAGRFIERKGLSTLVEAIDVLVKKNILDIEVFLFGEGEYSKKIKKLIQEKKLQDYIFIKPFANQIEDYFNAANLCVFPSHEGEGLMTVVLESMFYNGLVLTTLNNGNEEVIVNGKNGFLIPPANVQELADKINCLKKNSLNLKKIKSEAKKIIKKEFSCKSYYKNFMKIIKEFRK